MDDQIIHIFLCTDDNYCIAAAVEIFSITQNLSSGSLVVHVLDCGLTKYGRDIIEKSNRRSSVYFYSIKSPTFSRKIEFNGPIKHLNNSILFRFSIDRIIPDHVDRLIYLDCDMLAIDDIRPLWNINLSGKIIGSVKDKYVFDMPDNHEIFNKNHASSRHNPYFNSGLMLINVSQWKNLKVSDALWDCFFLNQKHLKYPDQDVLNIVLGDEYLAIDNKWNTMIGEDTKDADDIEISNIIKQASILHFVGPRKPWQENFPKNHFKSTYKKNFDQLFYEPNRNLT